MNHERFLQPRNELGPFLRQPLLNLGSPFLSSHTFVYEDNVESKGLNNQDMFAVATAHMAGLGIICLRSENVAYG